MEQLKKGSFTVELACLMPLYLLVIFTSIYLCFYVHNRAWLTAAAHESALIGATTRRSSDENRKNMADTRAKSLTEHGQPGMWESQIQTSVNGKEVRVRFFQNTTGVYGGISGQLQAEAVEKTIDPVAHIWKVKGLEGIVDSLRRKE